MKKNAYIIPGNLESHLKQPGYNKIAMFFETKNIKPIHVEMDWRANKVPSFDEYNKAFLKIYKKPKNTEVYILGFSFGALIAFLTALKTNPKALILCSLSPYFEEDLVTMRKDWVKYWRKRFPNEHFVFKDLVKKVKCKTYIITGEKESIWSLTRAKALKKKIKDSELYIAKGARHKISQKQYLEVVEKVISKV